MRQALGKGLDALIRQTETPNGADTVKKISISKIKPNRFQPRKTFRDESLQELAASIQKHGLAQPVALSYNPALDEYEIIAGERRFRAAQLAGLDEIDAIVRPKLDNEQMLALSLIENIQREDLNPVDTALAFRRLVETFGVAQTELARYCGKSKSAISNSLRLLELETEIQNALQASVISEGHARALLTLPDRAARKRLFHAAVAQKMTVRQVEDAARANLPLSEKSAAKRKSKKPPEIAEFESKLQQSLGTKVEIREGTKPHTGALVIHYYSFQELDRIAARLRGK